MIVYKNKYFSVQNNDKYFSLHFHFNSVVVVPIIQDKIILVKVFRNVLNDFLLELPAGHIDTGETPVEAARRELYEETGLNVQNLSKFESLGITYPMPSRTPSYINLFSVIISPDEFEKRGNHDEEIESTHLFEISQLDDLILNNKFCVSSHISAVHLFKLSQNKKKLINF